MYTDIHTDFISESLIEILKSGINACSSLSGGIESYPMAEYFMQSLFLKLTGALEQKMKCICWVLATNNYSYRYDFLTNKSYGECSSYDDKNKIFSDLIRCIKEIDPNFKLYHIWNDIQIDEVKIRQERQKWEDEISKIRNKKISDIIDKAEKKMNQAEKEKIEKNIYNKPLPEEDFFVHICSIKKAEWFQKQLALIKELLTGSLLIEWFPKESRFFTKELNSKFKDKDFAVNKTSTLLGGGMVLFYKTVVYNHRNRCAHNTLSYQRNLPSFAKLADRDYMYHNYFFRYTMIVLMDAVIVKLFNYYRGKCGDTFNV